MTAAPAETLLPYGTDLLYPIHVRYISGACIVALGSGMLGSKRACTESVRVRPATRRCGATDPRRVINCMLNAI